MSKPIKIIIISLISLILIGGGVYVGYYLKNNSDKPSDSDNKSTMTEVSNGKIFTNKQYGYSVKFPKSWFLYDEDLANVRIQLEQDQPKDTPEDQQLILGPVATALSISIVEIDQTKSLETLVREYLSPGADATWTVEIPTLESVTINGQKAIRTIASVCESIGCGPQWFVKNGKYLYVIVSPMLGYTDNPEYDQIVESFKLE